MGTALSLQDVMNDVSAAIERGGIDVPPPAKAMSEIEAFMTLDDLLTSLNKQYLDARHARQSVEKEFGADDPMTEVALLAEDSAWCAVQTRYMELRADRGLMRAAQKIMRDSQAQEAREQAAKEKREAMEKYYWLRSIEEAREKKDKSGWFWAFVVWYYLMYRPQAFVAFQPALQFNRMAA